MTLTPVPLTQKESVMQHEGEINNPAVQIKAIDDKPVVFKSPQTLRIISIVFAVTVASVGALWALSNLISSRPTDQEVDQRIGIHDGNGHRDVGDSINEIRVEQAQQKVLLEWVKETQIRQGKKLDALLERVPEKH